MKDNIRIEDKILYFEKVAKSCNRGIHFEPITRMSQNLSREIISNADIGVFEWFANIRKRETHRLFKLRILGI